MLHNGNECGKKLCNQNLKATIPSSTDYDRKKKILQNVEYFNYLGRITNDARCTCEIKSRTSKAKAEFSKKILFTSNLDLN